MYREKPKNVSYNFYFPQGGLGDLIARLPAVKYTLDHHPHIMIFMYVHDYGVELCRKALAGYTNIKIRGITDIKNYFNESIHTRSPDLHKITNLSVHMTDHAFYTLTARGVEDKYKNYLQIDPIDVSSFNLPEKYVCIATGFTSNSREFKPEHVYKISEYCIKKGYTPVYLGKSYTPASETEAIKGIFKADYSNGINLIDSTDLFQAHAIMAKGTAVIGLDSGLLHLAGMSNVPIIGGFSTVDPLHRMPYRNNILGWNFYPISLNKTELSCTFCQSNMNFTSGDHTFTDCFYKDFKCLDMLTSDKYINFLEKLL